MKKMTTLKTMKTKKALEVSRETVRSLSKATLGEIAGGIERWQSYPYHVCLE